MRTDRIVNETVKKTWAWLKCDGVEIPLTAGDNLIVWRQRKATAKAKDKPIVSHISKTDSGFEKR
jgi:hypothetical protein